MSGFLSLIGHLIGSDVHIAFVGWFELCLLVKVLLENLKAGFEKVKSDKQSEAYDLHR